MGEWRLDVRAQRNLPHQWSVYVKQWESMFFIYQIGLSRNPLQHVLTWVVPPIVTSMGAVLGLYLGCNSTERYSFGSSIVITLILMMTGLNDRLPVSDDGFPVLGLLYFSLCIIVTLTAFISTIPLALRRAYGPKACPRLERRGAEEIETPIDECRQQRQRLSETTPLDGVAVVGDGSVMVDGEVPRQRPRFMHLALVSHIRW